MTSAATATATATGLETHGTASLIPHNLKLSLREFVESWHRAQTRTIPDHWFWIMAWLHCMTERNAGQKGLLILAFRGAGKSTLTGFYAAWLLFCNPSLRIFLVAAEQSLAVKMSAHVRRILETHPEASSEAVPRTQRHACWARDTFTLQSAPSARDPSFVARGLEANLTGNRADLVICDDVEVPNSTRTHRLRDSLRERLDELQYIRVPDGATLYLGTPHGADSIYSDRESEDGIPIFLEDYNRLTLPARVPESERPIWGQVHTRESLAKKESTSSNFRAQMLLDLNARTEGAFALESLVRYDEELNYHEANGEQQLFLCGRKIIHTACRWDPSLGPEPGKDGRKRDRNVVAILFKDEEGNWMLHRILYLPAKPVSEPGRALDWYCGEVLRFVGQYHVRQIAVEDNGVGAFVPEALREVACQQNQQEKTVRVRAVHESKSKTQRIYGALDPLLAAGRFCVHSSVYKTPWIKEFRTWHPDLANPQDDGLDAVASAIADTAEGGAFMRVGVRGGAASGGGEGLAGRGRRTASVSKVRVGNF